MLAVEASHAREYFLSYTWYDNLRQTNGQTGRQAGRQADTCGQAVLATVLSLHDNHLQTQFTVVFCLHCPMARNQSNLMLDLILCMLHNLRD